MDEQTQEKTAQVQSDQEQQHSADGNKSQELDPIELANAAAERLEKANAEQKALLERQEKLYAKQRLGGKSSGVVQPEKKKVDPKEYAKAALQGKILPL